MVYKGKAIPVMSIPLSKPYFKEIPFPALPFLTAHGNIHKTKRKKAEAYDFFNN
jgi:hypothetical protein